MKINGSGIAETTVSIKPEYSPDTSLALIWAKLDSKKYVAADRTASNDTYEVEVNLAGRESYIDAVIDAIRANEDAGGYVLTLTDMSTAEQIFGPTVDYSSGVSVTVLTVAPKKQRSLKGFAVKLRLRLLPPVVFRGTASLPSFTYATIGHTVENKNSVVRSDTYEGAFTYTDLQSAEQRLKFNIELTDTDARNFKRFIETTRAGSFTVSSVGGVSKPFGTGSAFPASVRIVSFKEKFIGVGRSASSAMDWAYTVEIVPA